MVDISEVLKELDTLKKKRDALVIGLRRDLLEKAEKAVLNLNKFMIETNADERFLLLEKKPRVTNRE